MKKLKTQITTVKLSKKTKSRLDHFKEYRRETYDEILEKILEILNLSRSSPERARSRLISLDRKNRKVSSKKQKNPEISLSQKKDILENEIENN